MTAWQEGDRLFERLVEAAAPLGDAEREAFLARLVLLLADAVGDSPRVLAAIEEARRCER
jgi:Protein of unknown function (DUF2783)